MKEQLLRSLIVATMLLFSLGMSAYEQGDTILVGSDTDTTVFLEAEWFNPDSVTLAGASSVGATLNEGNVKAYLMNNNAVISYQLDVKGDGGVYDVVYAYRCVRYDRGGYFYMDLDGIRHGQLDAKQRSAYEGHPAWHSSYQSTSTDPNRTYVSLNLTPGLHELKFTAAGGSGNFYCDYFALVPRLSKTTTVACTSYDDTVKIEAEFFDPTQSTLSAGKTTMCVNDYSTCVGNNNSGNIIAFPLNVQNEGGSFKVEYVYNKMISSQSAWARPYLNDEVDYFSHMNLADTVAYGDEWNSVFSSTKALAAGSQVIKIMMGYTESQFVDYIRLIPIELTGVVTSLNRSISSQVKCFPSIVENELNFRGAHVTHATVFDFSGRQLTSQAILNNTLDVSLLRSGVYLVKSIDDSGIQSVHRIVKK